MASLLQSVLRQLTSTCVEVGEDAALLRRFVADGDQPAFAVLVRRHGGLVWGVCRQMLPTEADAEDAFQATFLALVRSARTAVGAKALGGWLHGVAVKVCLKSRRAVARQRKRDERAAKSEGVLPGELAWDDLHAAVHEEVEKLPAAHRTALVLCDLQGVRQHDAAARLGWKIGTLTGRLARARQQLLKRLTARGLAPSAVAGAVAFGGAAAAAAPPALADTVLTLVAGGAIPSAVLTLTTSVLEGSLMKVKLLAAAVLTATALTLGAGGWFATADAQPGPAGPPPGGDGRGRSGWPHLPGGGPAGPGIPGLGGEGPGVPPMGVFVPVPQPRVEHALVDLPNSEKKLTELFGKRQAEGWEFAGQVGYGQVGFSNDAGSGYAKLAFKRPAVATAGGASASPGGMGMPGGMMPGMGGPATLPPTPGVGGEGPGPGGLPMPPGAGAPADEQYRVLRLKHTMASDLAPLLTQLFKGDKTRIVADKTTNSLIVVLADPKLLEIIEAVVEKIDLPAKPTGPA